MRRALIKDSGFVIGRDRQLVTAGPRIFLNDILEPLFILIGFVTNTISSEILRLYKLMIWGKACLPVNPETVVRNARQRFEILTIFG